MAKEKESKFVEFIYDLPNTWFNAFRDAFIFIMFFELGFIMFKTFDLIGLFELHMKFLIVLVVGFFYLLSLSLLVYLITKYLIPNMKKKREKKKKEFFEELRKELKIK